VDAPDFDTRLGAYADLDQAVWQSMGYVEALPLLHAALADLRGADDLAARAAASQALSRLIAAVSAGPVGDGQTEAFAEVDGADAAVAAADGHVGPAGDGSMEVSAEDGVVDAGDAAGGSIVALAERVLYSQLKRTLASPSLAVRQVGDHLRP
jgi:hypothetical protein